MAGKSEHGLTICQECDNVHPASLKSHPRYWLCVKFPRLEGFGFVTLTTWTMFEPFMNCHGINGGACPLFTPKKEPHDAEHQ